MNNCIISSSTYSKRLASSHGCSNARNVARASTARAVPRSDKPSPTTVICRPAYGLLTSSAMHHKQANYLTRNQLQIPHAPDLLQHPMPEVVICADTLHRPKAYQLQPTRVDLDHL